MWVVFPEIHTIFIANPSAHSFFVDLLIISSLRKLQFFGVYRIARSSMSNEIQDCALRETTVLPHCFNPNGGSSSLGSFC